MDQDADHHMTGPSGLIAAIIRQALTDCHHRHRKVRADAERFFTDGRMRCWIEGTGIHPDSIIRRLRRIAGSGGA